MTRRHPGQSADLLAIPCPPGMAASLWYDQAESLLSDHEKQNGEKMKQKTLFDRKITHKIYYSQISNFKGYKSLSLSNIVVPYLLLKC